MGQKLNMTSQLRNGDNTYKGVKRGQVCMSLTTNIAGEAKVSFSPFSSHKTTTTN